MAFQTKMNDESEIESNSVLAIYISRDAEFVTEIIGARCSSFFGRIQRNHFLFLNNSAVNRLHLLLSASFFISQEVYLIILKSHETFSLIND